MNPFEFVIAILVIVFCFKGIDTYMKTKAARRSDEEAAASNGLLQRVGELEERVRVLERIVTDERYDLRRQFKDLGS
jgi:hypothetical protein